MSSLEAALRAWLGELDNNIPNKDTKEYVEWCHRRVQGLNSLGGPRMRVVPPTTLQQLRYLPRQPNDDALTCDWENTLAGWLSVCDDDGKVEGRRIICGFVSHRWLRPHFCEHCVEEQNGTGPPCDAGPRAWTS